MSRCVVVDDGEEGNTPPSQSHVHNPSYVVPMSSNYEVAEQAWENGQQAMHGLRRMLPVAAAGGTKPAWGRTTTTGDTLESIVHQATSCHHKRPQISNINGSLLMHQQEKDEQLAGKWGEITPDFGKKRLRSLKSDQCDLRYLSSTRRVHDHQEGSGAGAGAGAGAERRACPTFCREKTMTCPSFESPGSSFKTKTTDDDSACQDGSENRDEENETKGETVRSNSARRSRAAVIHNQSERRRRDRINQKMKALQKLVPNSCKTDKASMLDEVIGYVQLLQAQVHMMSTRTMPQMMINPLAMQQQQLQMSLLARMGMGVGLGMGMGMLDMNHMARSAPHQPLIHATSVAYATPTFVPPQFLVPPPGAAIPTCTRSPADLSTTNTVVNPFGDPCSAFLAQQSAASVDFYSKMAALYRQQANQTAQASSKQSQADFMQRE